MLGSIKHVNFEHVLFHPSGVPTPSPEDIEVTNRLYEAGKIVGVDLLDHVIIGDHQFISMKEKGYF